MKRKMKIGYKAGTYFATAVPMLLIANRYLRDIAKICVGDTVEVEYQEGALIISKTENI